MGCEFLCGVQMGDWDGQKKGPNCVCADGDDVAGDALKCLVMKERMGRQRHCRPAYFFFRHANHGNEKSRPLRRVVKSPGHPWRGQKTQEVGQSSQTCWNAEADRAGSEGHPELKGECR
jgi:hypothetical protein